MSLGKIYKDLLQKKIILSHLVNGEIPHKKQIDIELREATKDNPFLDKPFTDKDQYRLSFAEPASSSKFNKMIEGLDLDMNALYGSIFESAQITTDFTDKVSNSLKVFEKDLSLLEDEVTNLLLSASDIEGFARSVSDNFANMDKVNLDYSTVSINNSTYLVQLPLKLNQRVAISASSEDVQFNILSKSHLISSKVEPDSDLINALLDTGKTWVQRVSYLQPPFEFQGEYILRFLKREKISKITVRPVSDNKGSVLNLVVQYSQDGINWSNVSGEGNKRLITDTDFHFESVSAPYWKFFFSKSGYDEFLGDSYTYRLGLRAIEFYSLEYDQNSQKLSEAVLYSEPLSLEDASLFNKVSLKVCDLVPLDTSLDYRIALLTQSDFNDYSNGTVELPDFIYSDIDPIDREFKTKPILIDGAKLLRLQNFSSLYSFDSITGHKYKNNINNVLIDLYQLSPSVTPDTIKVLRNVGDNTLDGGSNQSIFVNNVNSGWLLDNDYYICEFYVSDEDGTLIDFGLNELEIDSLKSSGLIRLSKGSHKIRTHRRNWLDISPSSISSPSDPNPDFLYPFNHKLLIEGLSDFLYGVNLDSDLGSGVTRRMIIDPNQVYIPLAKYWAKTLKLISLFDFAFKVKDSDYSVCAVVDDALGNERIMIKYNTEANLFTNEKFAIIEDQIVGTLYSHVVLKATFKSIKNINSPFLNCYTIRLGL